MSEIYLDGGTAGGFSQTCCFTGPRPKNYPWGQDEAAQARVFARLEREIARAVGRGYRVFLCGMAAGVDLVAARAVLRLRAARPEGDIRLEAAVPFPSQPARWRAEMRQEYRAILAACDAVHTLSDKFSVAAYALRDAYMVWRSSLVIAVEGKTKGGSARAAEYAERLGREVIRIAARPA